MTGCLAARPTGQRVAIISGYLHFPVGQSLPNYWIHVLGFMFWVGVDRLGFWIVNSGLKGAILSQVCCFTNIVDGIQDFGAL